MQRGERTTTRMRGSTTATRTTSSSTNSPRTATINVASKLSLIKMEEEEEGEMESYQFSHGKGKGGRFEAFRLIMLSKGLFPCIAEIRNYWGMKLVSAPELFSILSSGCPWNDNIKAMAAFSHLSTLGFGKFDFIVFHFAG